MVAVVARTAASVRVIIDVDTASAVPAYEQVRSQLSEMILAGSLPAGHRLPPIRQLAADLGLAPGTIARVYGELEASGLVTSRVRHGTVVNVVPQASAAERRARTREAARAFVLAAQRMEVGLDEALDAVRDSWGTTG